MSGSPAEPVVAALEARRGAEPGLRVEWLRRADRHAHRVLAVGYEPLPVVLLESVEGAEEAWPASPALQALNLDELAGGNPEPPRAAMLVGMAGSSHWSLTIDVAEAAAGRAAGLLFDVACRVKEEPGYLGSTYRLGGRVAVRTVDRETVALDFGAGRCRLTVLPIDDAAAPAWQWDRSRHSLTAEVPQGGIAAPPTTVRWRYQLAVAEG